MWTTMIDPREVQVVPNEENSTYRKISFLNRENVIEVSINGYQAAQLCLFLQSFDKTANEEKKT